MFFCRRHLSHVLFTATTRRLLSHRVGHRDSTTVKRIRKVYQPHEWLKQPPHLAHKVLSNLVKQAESLSDFRLVMSDVLHKYKPPDPSDKIFPLKNLIDSEYFRQLEEPEALALVTDLRDASDGWQTLRPKLFDRIVFQVCPVLSKEMPNRTLLPILHPEILNQLRSLPPPTPSATYQLPPIVRLAFLYIRDLLHHGCNAEVLQIFSILLENKFIDALPALSVTEDLRVIVLLTLAKACLRWNRRDFSLELLINAIEGHGPFNQTSLAVVSEVILEIMHTAISAPRYAELDSCLRLMHAIHPTHPLPDVVVHNIYLAAYKGAFAPIGMALFKFINNLPDTHRYPPPPPSVCRWLLECFQDTAAASHSARTLISQVLDQEIPVPLADRPIFIADSARSGFATLAKKLWLRYTVGQDRTVVTGNPSVLLRMVSLNMHLYKKKTSTSDKVLRSQSTVQDFRADEAKAFVATLLEEFFRAHEPFGKADHFILTTFARACFMAGRTTEAMEVYKILSDRNEAPDFYDISIVLKSLAERDPHTAASMIDRVLKTGYRPPGAMFGSVMHHALERGDVTLFRDLMSKATNAGVKLTPQTLISLIRSTASSASQAEPRLKAAKFLGSLRVVKAMTNMGFMMSPHLGKYLVHTALSAGQPRIAYRFWRFIVAPSTERVDVENQQMRSSIAQGIVQLNRQGEIGQRRAAAMLRVLGRLGILSKTE